MFISLVIIFINLVLRNLIEKGTHLSDKALAIRLVL